MAAEKPNSQPGLKNISRSYNKYIYCLFVLVSIVYLFLNDLMMASCTFGLAMAFDPFNQSVKWQDRKLYQRVWLVVHLLGFVALFVTALIIKP